MIGRPDLSESAPFHAAYIALVPGENIVEAVASQGDSAIAFYSAIQASQGDLRYAPEKWSIKETLGHIIDTERIQAYRALRFARNDNTTLPGFDQDNFVAASGSESRTLADLVEEFAAVRRSSVLLLRSFAPDVWLRSGVANNHTVTVRALSYILVGHELHHREILKQRYLA